jgi:hypothetical protein
MHVRRQERVDVPTAHEATAVCKFKCKFSGCGWVFGNKHGLAVHQGKCKHANTFEVEKILEHQADRLPVGLGKSKFRVKWKDYGLDDASWEPFENFNENVIKKYLQANGTYDYGWQHRCHWCDKPCKSAHGVKIHYARKCKKFEMQQQEFVGTIATKLHEVKTKKSRQVHRPVIKCENEPLENCYQFKYLGSLFTADGSEVKDIKKRIALAVGRCGKLRHILQSSTVKLTTKLKIYRCAVGSLFTYGSEAWCINEKCRRMLNGANAGCLHRFTGKTRIEESRPTTCTYSLVSDIRRRRLTWLGHILRMDDNRLVKIAARVQCEMRERGNLFCDAPGNLNFNQLCNMASDRGDWREMVCDKLGNIQSNTPRQDNSEPVRRNPRRRCAMAPATTATDSTAEDTDTDSTAEDGNDLPLTRDRNGPMSVRRNPRRRCNGLGDCCHEPDCQWTKRHCVCG